MRVVLDTNVLMSGIFFGGVPGRILESWRGGEFELTISPSVFDEYRRVAEILEGRYGRLEVEPLLALLLSEGILVEDCELPEPVSDDPDDDKFLACALTAAAAVVVSGDRDLRDVGAYRGIEVLTPRRFLEKHLAEP